MSSDKQSTNSTFFEKQVLGFSYISSSLFPVFTECIEGSNGVVMALIVWWFGFTTTYLTVFRPFGHGSYGPDIFVHSTKMYIENSEVKPMY